MSQSIEIERHDQIAEVALNRPEAYNALNLEMVSQLADRLTDLAVDDRTKAVVITGKGKAFSAGGDLKWALEYADRPDGAFHRLAGVLHLAITEIKRTPKPVIAAINGVAAGAGFSLALACDFRVMEKSAFLKQAYTSAGLCIDGGGTFAMPRIVGHARAMEIAAFDEPMSAGRALDWGLVTKVVDDGQALDEALSMARKLSGRSLNSFVWAKKLLTDSFDTSLETQLEKERTGLEACAGHPDGREGLAAFAEKRKPKF
jgi:2-(1,2-epoxy-1,2-dihydrophenyl)acetyl-CoA isomerase